MLALGFPEGWEWIIILVIALLIFGARLPKVMRSLGRSLSEFKKGIHEAERAADIDDDNAASKPSDEDEDAEGGSSSPAG